MFETSRRVYHMMKSHPVAACQKFVVGWATFASFFIITMEFISRRYWRICHNDVSSHKRYDIKSRWQPDSFFNSLFNAHGFWWRCTGQHLGLYSLIHLFWGWSHDWSYGTPCDCIELKNINRKTSRRLSHDLSLWSTIDRTISHGNLRLITWLIVDRHDQSYD